MKPDPIKAFSRPSKLSNLLFSQAQEIKRLKVENAQLRADNARKDKLLLDMQRHAEGIVKAWNNGILSAKEIR